MQPQLCLAGAEPEPPTRRRGALCVEVARAPRHREIAARPSARRMICRRASRKVLLDKQAA
jgi:hypothetical protein